MQMGKLLHVPLLEDLGILNSLTKPFLTPSQVGDGNVHNIVKRLRSQVQPFCDWSYFCNQQQHNQPFCRYI